MRVKRRMIIAIAILGSATALLWGAVAIPAALAIKAEVNKIGIEEGKIDERYALLRLARTTVTNLADIEKRFANLSAVALHEGKEIEFVTAVETAANDTHVDQQLALETVNQKDLSTWEKEIPVKIEVQGKYGDVLAFLDRIERLPQYVIVNSVSLLAPLQGSEPIGDGTVHASIAGTVYWQAAATPDYIAGTAGPKNQ